MNFLCYNISMPIDDKFYTEFEEKFRGTEQDIKKRLRFYIPLLKVYAEAYPSSKPTALDIGCGRGEMLSIYTELGFEAFGIDTNKVVLEQTRSKGFNVTYADALDFLKSQKPDTYDAISLIHVLEHLSFEYAFELHKEVLRVLKPGGAYIVEFPFAENLITGTIGFWLDPSHIKPINPDMVKFVWEYLGFEKVDYFGVNAIQKPLEDMRIEDLRSLYVAPDVSIVGIKPTANRLFFEKAKEALNYLKESSSHRIDNVLHAVSENTNSKIKHLQDFSKQLDVKYDKAIQEIITEYQKAIENLREEHHQNLEAVRAEYDSKISTLYGIIDALKGQIKMLVYSKPWKIYYWIGNLKKKLLRQKPDEPFFFEQDIIGNLPFRDIATGKKLTYTKELSYKEETKDNYMSPLEQKIYKKILRLKDEKVYERPTGAKPKLAYISPLPPEKTGVSWYSEDLLPHLSEHYDIELIIDQKIVKDNLREFPIRDVDFFVKNYAVYDRVLYHMGNSRFHKHMLNIVEDCPGVVVMHDFYISDLIYWMEYEVGYKHYMSKELYHSHGYTGLLYLKEKGVESTTKKYPINLRMLQDNKGIIVHSSYPKQLAEEFYVDIEDKWFLIKQLREIGVNIDKIVSKRKLGFSQQDFLICSFGYIGFIKFSSEILEAFLNSNIINVNNVKLVFVGENPGGAYGNEILNKIQKNNLENKTIITGFVDDETFKDYLSACDIAIQLRTMSRGETSRAVLDTLAYGIPTIVNAHGSMTDLPDDVVYKLDEKFKIEDLIKALENLYFNEEKRNILSKNAIEYIQKEHNPSKIALDYKKAMESAYNLSNEDTIVKNGAKHINLNFTEEIIGLAKSITKQIKPMPGLKQLLVDVSVIVREDMKTGIQRVAKAQLLNLIKNPPDGFRIEPIYLYNLNGKWIYKYARDFTLRFLGIEGGFLEDEPIDFFESDIFFTSDLFYPISEAVYLLKAMKDKNVKITFTIHDILPITMPNYFPQESKRNHELWLDAISSYADKLICVSKAVAKDVTGYLIKRDKLRKDLEITYLYNGSDIKSVKHAEGIGYKNLKLFENIKQNPYFLVVSTIEPRKGHRQVLKAFEKLWERRYNFNLVFVGKKGWMMDDFMDYIEKHHEKNKRFFYLGHVSDDMLENLYENATATIMASEGEGFGLSIIESAHYKTPIIARDISVFREVAKDGAYYFPNTNDENTLAEHILKWYELYKENKHPKPDDIEIMSWEEHTEKLKEILLK